MVGSLSVAEVRATTALLWTETMSDTDSQELPAHDFKLVTEMSDYGALSDAGYDVIMVQRRPSGHFSAPLPVRIVGPFIMPWRWRRTLLNEGISKVYVAPTKAGLVIATGAILARTKISLSRSAQRIPTERHRRPHNQVDD